MELRQFLKLFPIGKVWEFNPSQKKYKLACIFVDQLKQLILKIEELKSFVQRAEDSQTSNWERMLKIENIETGDRIDNIRTKVVGQYGRLNRAMINSIISRYTDDTPDFNVTNGNIFDCTSSCSDSLGEEGGIFSIILEIKNKINNKKLFEMEINEARHAHTFLKINYV